MSFAMPSATCSLRQGVPNKCISSIRISRNKTGNILTKATLDSIIADQISHTAPVVEQQALFLQNRVASLVHAGNIFSETLETVKTVLPDAKELESTVYKVVEPCGLDFQGWQPHWGRKLFSSALVQLADTVIVEFTKVFNHLLEIRSQELN